VFRYVVLTDPVTAPGFRLAGVEVREVDPSRVATELRRCLAEPEVGLVALSDRFAQDLPEDLVRHVDEGVPPTVILFPDPRSGAEAGTEDALRRLIQRAIGYRIRLRA